MGEFASVANSLGLPGILCWDAPSFIAEELKIPPPKQGRAKTGLAFGSAGTLAARESKLKLKLAAGLLMIGEASRIVSG